MVVATPLTAAEGDALAQRIAVVESRTGTQIVTLLVAKSDAYVELPWIAFALGASLAAFAVVLFDLLRPDWRTQYVLLSGAVAILAPVARSRCWRSSSPRSRVSFCATPG